MQNATSNADIKVIDFGLAKHFIPGSGQSMWLDLEARPASESLGRPGREHPTTWRPRYWPELMMRSASLARLQSRASYPSWVHPGCLELWGDLLHPAVRLSPFLRPRGT